MKLSVNRRWGFVHVRGGRVLTVVHDHQIPAYTYDAGVDDKVNVPEWALETGAKPLKKRQFDAKWASAGKGDLAIEIVARKTETVIGYGYLSGGAINMIRYVDSDRALVGSWFEPSRALRFDIPSDLVRDARRPSEHQAGQFILAVVGVKYSGASVAYASVETEDVAGMETLLGGLQITYGGAVATGREATTHLLVTATIRKSKAVATLHCQPPASAGDYACQPFFHQLLQSSPDLVSHEFVGPPWASIDPPNVPTPP